MACVRVLLDNNYGDIDEQDKWGNTALHLAVRKRHVALGMALMQAGADVDLVNCVRELIDLRLNVCLRTCSNVTD